MTVRKPIEYEPAIGSRIEAAVVLWTKLGKVNQRPRKLMNWEKLTKSRSVMKGIIGVSIMLLCFLAARISGAGPQPAQFEDVPDNNIGAPNLNSLRLDGETREAVERAVESREYTRAEEILVKEIAQKPNSYPLLTFLGRIFFLNGKYLNCAIAIKKADAVSSLKDQDRFTLALCYIILNHSDWARLELEKLAASDPVSPLYQYWLGRIDYDKMHFSAAVARFQKALKLKPNFMKAYDNLGLTYEGLGNYDDAVEIYSQAVDLNRKQQFPSPWPPLNLGTLLIKLGKSESAEGCLRESLRYDPRFPKTHCQLGLLLEKENKDQDAVRELRQAAQYDPTYPEPHYILGRIYQRGGKKTEAEIERKTFQRLKEEQHRVRLY